MRWEFCSPGLQEAPPSLTSLVQLQIHAKVCASYAECTTSAACAPCSGKHEPSWHLDTAQNCLASAR
eukprot:5968148-Ditylum_brightwellii.AAC.2